MPKPTTETVAPPATVPTIKEDMRIIYTGPRVDTLLANKFIHPGDTGIVTLIDRPDAAGKVMAFVNWDSIPDPDIAVELCYLAEQEITDAQMATADEAAATPPYPDESDSLHTTIAHQDERIAALVAANTELTAANSDLIKRVHDLEVALAEEKKRALLPPPINEVNILRARIQQLESEALASLMTQPAPMIEVKTLAHEVYNDQGHAAADTDLESHRRAGWEIKHVAFNTYIVPDDKYNTPQVQCARFVLLERTVAPPTVTKPATRAIEAATAPNTYIFPPAKQLKPVRSRATQKAIDAMNEAPALVELRDYVHEMAARRGLD